MIYIKVNAEYDENTYHIYRMLSWDEEQMVLIKMAGNWIAPNVYKINETILPIKRLVNPKANGWIVEVLTKDELFLEMI